MGAIQDLWLKWKMLKLPWRKTFFVGKDLGGNTFWEFKDKLNANRLRRIVRYSRKTHFSDIKVSPQWHQWLRHTRAEPPSIQEQQADLGRQAQLKFLAQAADERWASKPSVLDKPSATQATIPEGQASQTPGPQSSWTDSARDTTDGEQKTGGKPKKESPWDNEKGGPSQNWQPEAWTPGPKKRPANPSA